jgi:uncharacterized protein (TIGR03437 family)
VRFNGTPVPAIVRSGGAATVTVPQNFAASTAELSIVGAGIVVLPLVDASPGLFTIDRSGGGQGAILNQDFSVNGSTNAAERGSVVMLFGTGGHPYLPVGVTMGGVAAEVWYAGAAPGLPEGMLQVNARVPLDAPAGPAIPVSVTVGMWSTQPGVTIAVR